MCFGAVAVCMDPITQVLFTQIFYYHPDRFGNDKINWKYYDASNEVFIEQSLVEYYLALLHHGWVSSEGKCEAYNELHRNKVNVQKVQRF